MSLHDTTWQAEEYERLMGKDRRERQEKAARLERGQCVCRSRTLKTKNGYRTVHEQHCIKFKDWMTEYLVPKQHAASGAAHAEAIHGNVVPLVKRDERT
jgi:hypothetical protein